MRNSRPATSERGFTLVEAMMAVMLVGILSSMAVMQIASARPGYTADGAMRTVVGQLNYARDLAVSTRREIRVDFDLDTNAITLVRLALPGEENDETLSTIRFEGGVGFGLDSAAGDPDGFGHAAAVDFDATPIMFTTDGTLVNTSRSPINGSVFLLIENNPNTYRAVTVLGATGRIRGYRWNGMTWTRA